MSISLLTCIERITQVTYKRTQHALQTTLRRFARGKKILPVSNFAQQLPTTRKNMQQSVKTDATRTIQQYWELLANNVASVCT